MARHDCECDPGTFVRKDVVRGVLASQAAFEGEADRLRRRVLELEQAIAAFCRGQVPASVLRQVVEPAL